MGCLGLGFCHLNGTGVAQDRSKGVTFLRETLRRVADECAGGSAVACETRTIAEEALKWVEDHRFN